MQKKLTRKEKIALQQQGGATPAAKRQPAKEQKSNVKRILGLFVAILAFAIYSNTFSNWYVLDDWGLMPENTMVKKGISGIPEIFQSSYRAGMNINDYQLYRPLSKAMFAVEWQFSPGNPALGHWMNVIWFALTCLLLFHVLTVLLKGNLLVPFITALLFATHPLHTEVVANIKSRDEIMSLLLLLATLLWTVRYSMTNKVKLLIGSAITFFLALLSKESAITWLAVIPLALYFFTDAKSSTYIKSSALLFLSTAVFLIIRRKILGNVDLPIPVVDNSLVAIKNVLVQRANAISILGYYLKLLVLPITLCSDGSFNTFPELSLFDWKVITSLALLVGMGVYAIIRFRKKDPVSFGILYFLVTISIVSNVLILIGTNYGERLLFLPSLGFCFVVAVLLQRGFNLSAEQIKTSSFSSFMNSAGRPVYVAAFICLLFSIKTMARNKDWKSDTTLFDTDLQTVPNSTHMLFYRANHITAEEELLGLDSLQKKKVMDEAVQLLSRAVEIYPGYADAYQRRGYIRYTEKEYSKAEADYLKALEHNPTHPVTHNNYGNLLFNQRKYPEAMEHFKLAAQYNPFYAHAINNIASVYGVYAEGQREQAQKDPANQAQHLEEARRLFETAVTYFLKAIEIDPGYPDPYNLVGMTYRYMGDEANAEKYVALGKKVQREKLEKQKRNNAKN